MSELIKIDSEYRSWISEISRRFRQSQIKASIAVNSGMLAFYWSLGRDIVIMKAETRWGSKFMEALSLDLQTELPIAKGFSVTNLRYMRNFYTLYAPLIKKMVDLQIPPQLGGEFQESPLIPPQLGGEIQKTSENVPQLEGQLQIPAILCIPWGHHKLIIDKFAKGDKLEEALFYVQQTLENNWSRAVLMNFLDTNLYERQGKAITNFKATLPPEKSDLAQELTRDPYCFDFLTLAKGYREKELKDALMENVTKFLMELGKGFAFLGREYRLQVGETEQFMDMLFYNIPLRCYVVVEVKVSDFEPADIGQLLTYVSVVDGIMRKKEDGQTIGLLICKTKDNVLAKYATAGVSLPIGISEYELSNLLPDDFKATLPSISEIENGLKASDERT